MSDYPPIPTLIPHAGSMCLLSAIAHSDDDCIRCLAVSHRDPANPLRRDGQLAAIHAVEYAAQAVAVHGGLRRPAGSKPRGGMIAVLTNIGWHVDRLDSVREDLQVEAHKLADLDDGLSYGFRVLAEDAVLVEGELMIALQPDTSPEAA
ncbi:MAG: 3-hydroxylacyl-ACP dehydratase [Gammaproteobacteria bacterium]|nr:MAG: 3-hydroxylacyl-ACP dehydratase [Gammaproteobacteria bacterium]